MIQMFRELTCDMCGDTAMIADGFLPYGWWECHEMANGDGSSNVIYKYGGEPLVPKRHVCPACAKKIFGTEVDDDK